MTLVALCILVPAAILGGVLLAGDGDDDDPVVTPPPGATDVDVAIGAPLPDFTLPAVDGGSVTLSDFRGRPLVLTFFASWCNPCEEEMPLLEEAWTDDQGRFGVLAVSYDDLERDSRAFVDRLGVTYPAVLDVDDQVKDAYGVGAIPQTFFVDADGVLRDRVFGVTSRSALDPPLDALLAGEDGSAPR